MKHTLRIGLDFDGVITHLGKLKALVSEELFDKKLPPDKHGHFDLFWAMEEKFLNETEYEAMKAYAYYERGALNHMHAVHGALSGIQNLLDRGHELHIITAREEGALDNIKEWLARHNITVPVVGVGFANTKRNAAKGFDVFVDDYLIQLYHLRDTVPHRFLYSWEYNAQYDEKDYAVRVKSWNELYEKIIALEDGKALHRKRG